MDFKRTSTIYIPSNGCKEMSIENTLRKTYSWLKFFYILPKYLSQSNRAQVGKLAAKIGQLYVVDNRELFSLFFSDFMDSTNNRLTFIILNCFIVPVGAIFIYLDIFLCQKWFSGARNGKAIKLLPRLYWICLQI